MSKKFSKSEVHAKVSTLLKAFIDAELQKATARRELERMLSRDWVDRLEEVVSNDRFVCGACGLDFDELNMANDDTCYGCSRTQRISSAVE